MLRLAYPHEWPEGTIQDARGHQTVRPPPASKLQPDATEPASIAAARQPSLRRRTDKWRTRFPRQRYCVGRERSVQMALREAVFQTPEVALNYAEGPSNGPSFVLLHGGSTRWQY